MNVVRGPNGGRPVTGARGAVAPGTWLQGNDVVNPPARSARRTGPGAALAAAALGLALAWEFAPTVRAMAERWATDPRYSHGFLVPAFALGLLWLRRDRRPAGRPGPGPGWAWLGVAAAGVGASAHLAASYVYWPWAEGLALLPALAGTAALLGGRAGLAWAGPSVGFLAYMVPLPYRVEVALGAPLQGVATACSTYALQTLGLPAVAEGYVIAVNDWKVGVVEACNGLGMLATFSAMAAGLALVLRRPWPDRVMILLSAAPIALAANVARITATGVLREAAGPRLADAVYHDLAGWLMMPLALALLAGEVWLLDRLLVADPGPAAGPALSPGLTLGRALGAPPSRPEPERNSLAEPE